MSHGRQPKTHHERALQGEVFEFYLGTTDNGDYRIRTVEYIPTFKKTPKGMVLAAPTCTETDIVVPASWYEAKR